MSEAANYGVQESLFAVEAVPLTVVAATPEQGPAVNIEERNFALQQSAANLAIYKVAENFRQFTSTGPGARKLRGQYGSDLPKVITGKMQKRTDAIADARCQFDQAYGVDAMIAAGEEPADVELWAQSSYKAFREQYIK